MDMDNLGALVETTKRIKQGDKEGLGWGGETSWRSDSLRMTRSWLHERFREIPGRGTIKRKIAGEGAWQSWRAEGRPEQWEQRVRDGVAGQPSVLLDPRKEFGADGFASNFYNFI